MKNKIYKLGGIVTNILAIATIMYIWSGNMLNAMFCMLCIVSQQISAIDNKNNKQ